MAAVADVLSLCFHFGAFVIQNVKELVGRDRGET